MLEQYINLLTPSLPSPAVSALPPGLPDHEKRACDNDEGGDGPSCPSPQKVLVFFCYYIYIPTNIHPLLPSRSSSTSLPRHSNRTRKTRPVRRVFRVRVVLFHPPAPSSQTRERVPLWDALSCLATFRLPEHHLRAQIGTLVVSAGSPPLPPARHENASRLGTRFRVWLHSFHPVLHPSLQPDTKLRPIWGAISCPPTFPPLPTFGIFFLVLYFFTIPPSPYSSVFLFYLAFFYHFRQFPLYNVTHLGIFLLCKLSYLNK